MAGVIENLEKAKLEELKEDKGEEEEQLEVITFSYKKQEDKNLNPMHQWTIIDCRCLFNPFWSLKKMPHLKDATGEHEEIRKMIVEGDNEAFSVILDRALHLYKKGRRHFAFGCTGGVHRSVCMAKEFKSALNKL
jgi:UPF0042 nucleotide-binding protein